MAKVCKYIMIQPLNADNNFFWCKKYKTYTPTKNDGCWNNTECPKGKGPIEGRDV
jgi:hypothetical protein